MYTHTRAGEGGRRREIHRPKPLALEYCTTREGAFSALYSTCVGYGDLISKSEDSRQTPGCDQKEEHGQCVLLRWSVSPTHDEINATRNLPPVSRFRGTAECFRLLESKPPPTPHGRILETHCYPTGRCATKIESRRFVQISQSGLQKLVCFYADEFRARNIRVRAFDISNAKTTNPDWKPRF